MFGRILYVVTQPIVVLVVGVIVAAVVAAIVLIP